MPYRKNGKILRRQDIVAQSNPCEITFVYDGIIYLLNKCSSKLVRHILIKSISVDPICEVFWEKKYTDYNFNWNEIWLNIPSKVKEARLVSLNWKILSNIYPTNILLHKMGKASSSNCTTCNKKDYLEHFFYQCKK